jgi:hypothetical protein
VYDYVIRLRFDVIAYSSIENENAILDFPDLGNDEVLTLYSSGIVPSPHLWVTEFFWIARQSTSEILGEFFSVDPNKKGGLSSLLYDEFFPDMWHAEHYWARYLLNNKLKIKTAKDHNIRASIVR